MATRSGRKSSMVIGLNEEWQRLVDAGGIPAVGGHELDGCSDVADVLQAIRAAPDAILLALILAAHAGDALAARVVLQAMLPKMILLAARDARAGIEDYLAQLWCVVAGYPVHRRPVRIAANLAMDTRKRVHAELDRRGWGRWSVVDEAEGAVEAWVDADAEVDDLLVRARELGLVDAHSEAVLRTVYVDGLTSREAAERHGGSADMVRFRCSRTVRRLARHSGQLVAAA